MSVSMKHAAAYMRYLRSPEWRAHRERALAAADHRCQRCGAPDELEVHHLSYDRLGFERPQDLQVLCNPCHALEHGRGAKRDRVMGVEEAFWIGMARGLERDRELDELETEQARVLAAALGYEV